MVGTVNEKKKENKFGELSPLKLYWTNWKKCSRMIWNLKQALSRKNKKKISESIMIFENSTILLNVESWHNESIPIIAMEKPLKSILVTEFLIEVRAENLESWSIRFSHVWYVQCEMSRICLQVEFQGVRAG